MIDLDIHSSNKTPLGHLNTAKTASNLVHTPELGGREPGTVIRMTKTKEALEALVALVG
jgi:hypothetical protein